MSPRFDPSLCLVTDRGLCLGRALPDVVRQAVTGGVTLVQLREKTASTRDFVGLGRELLAVLAPLGVPLIINDRVDVALAVGAQGVHLGQSDMDAADARTLLGPDAVIGLSVETSLQLAQAQTLPVDYLGLSPLFSTPTKTDTAPPWGLDGLRLASRQSRLPVMAIGGINASNARLAMQAGAAGVAVVSAICSAPLPQEAAATLRGLVVDASRGKH